MLLIKENIIFRGHYESKRTKKPIALLISKIIKVDFQNKSNALSKYIF